MRYELYIDSLFLINFVMNLYLLILISRSTPGTATPWRLFAGAAFAAFSYLIPFFFGGFIWLRVLVGFFAGTVGMLFLAFRITGFRAFCKLFEKLLLYSLGMGGAILFIIRCFPFLRKFLTGIFGIMGIGAVAVLLFLQYKKKKRETGHLCRATLIRKGDKMTVAALLDSGNSLIEPISGKPVSIIEQRVFNSLWKEEMSGYRAVPYHSIGKRRGILQGYLLPELRIEVDGVVRTCKNVYVAVGEEGLHGGENSSEESVKMILNPAVLNSC